MMMTETDKTTPCIGCGALVPAIDGPTHSYLGASPGCWAIYGEVLAKEYSDFRFASVHQLTTNTYAVQHPGKPERRTIQSVAVHLIGLYVLLELGFGQTEVTQVLKNGTEYSSTFTWLEPPDSLGVMTIVDVQQAEDNADEHKRLVNDWARAAWAAWEQHHPQILRWATHMGIRLK